MNSSIAFTVGSSDQLQGGFNNFTLGPGRLLPIDPGLTPTARQRTTSPVVAFDPHEDGGEQAELSVPVAENRSKPARAASEALGFGLGVTFVLGVGATWAWVVVQLAVLVSQMEPLVVRNILWTHQ